MGCRGSIGILMITWNLRIHPWKRRNIFQSIIFRFHVSLGGCMTRSIQVPSRSRWRLHASQRFSGVDPLKYKMIWNTLLGPLSTVKKILKHEGSKSLKICRYIYIYWLCSITPKSEGNVSLNGIYPKQTFLFIWTSVSTWCGFEMVAESAQLHTPTMFLYFEGQFLPFRNALQWQSIVKIISWLRASWGFHCFVAVKSWARKFY